MSLSTRSNLLLASIENVPGGEPTASITMTLWLVWVRPATEGTLTPAPLVRVTPPRWTKPTMVGLIASWAAAPFSKIFGESAPGSAMIVAAPLTVRVSVPASQVATLAGASQAGSDARVNVSGVKLTSGLPLLSVVLVIKIDFAPLLILNPPDVLPNEPAICEVPPSGTLEPTVKLPTSIVSGASAPENTPGA